MSNYNQRNKNRPIPLNTVLKKVLGKIQSQYNQKELSLNAFWYSIVGEKISQHTKLSMNRSKILTVTAENSAWLNELTFLKEKIKIKAKLFLSQHGIEFEDIIFKLGKTK
ncbi:MAG: DUF721 domain-containing protein [candidate division FCPU426 bacterium]